MIFYRRVSEENDISVTHTGEENKLDRLTEFQLGFEWKMHPVVRLMSQRVCRVSVHDPVWLINITY